MSGHREKALEAAEAIIATSPRKAVYEMAWDLAEAAIKAAEPHLQRMHWEQLREELEGDEATDAASSRFEQALKDEGFDSEFPESFMREALQAAVVSVLGDKEEGEKGDVRG